MAHYKAIRDPLFVLTTLIITHGLAMASARTLLDDNPIPFAPFPSPVDTPTPIPTMPPAPPTVEQPTPVAPPPETTTPPPAPPLGGDHSTLTFFMHDILGGTHPTARAVTGIVTNVAASGELAFAKPTRDFPANSGVQLPNTNGLDASSGNVQPFGNIQPFLTGLGGTASMLRGGAVVGSGTLPTVGGGQLPLGATLEKLEFGTITVIDDELTQGVPLGSPVVGKAQGFYVASSQDGSSQTMAFTALLESGGFADSISFFGVHRSVVSESHIAIVGGTGKYLNAKGYATIQTISAADTHETDGVQTVLEFLVYLSY